MSTSVYKKEFRVWSVLTTFKKSVFLTLTTADCVGISEIRQRWRIFRHDYFRALNLQDDICPRWIMCYEPHPHGHGWHVHVVIESSYLDVRKIRKYSSLAGFGRIHIESVFSSDLDKYISKYVCKIESGLRARGCKRLRLLNISRGLTTLNDIAVQGALSTYISNCMKFPVVTEGATRGLNNYQLAIAFLLFGHQDGWSGIDFVPESWEKFRADCLAACSSSSASGPF